MKDKYDRYLTLLYYKYAKLKNPQKLAEQHLGFCRQHNILGRIIIAGEGINGTCAGKIEDIVQYTKFVRNIKGLEDIWFKEHYTGFIPFKKIFVRCRKEIVNSGLKHFKIKKAGKYVSPEELNRLYEKNEDFIILDARNEIESKVGHFKNAVTPKINHFRDLPEYIKKFNEHKNNKIILYCTGGIRCEKASALMVKLGFKDVNQLEGGIYNYCKKFPNGNFLGICYVFDNRINVAFDKNNIINNQNEIPEEKIITYCSFCPAKTARVINDERDNKRKQIICCRDCDNKYLISV